MEEKLKRKFILWLFFLAYTIMIFVIFVLPSFTTEGYSILENTTSQLGAQSTPNAWIMNVVFISLGFFTILSALSYLRNLWFQKIILIIFGLSLIMAALYRHAPISPELPFNPQEDDLHSLFADVCGYSFVIFAIAISFVEKTSARRALALSVGIGATLLSLAMFLVPDYMGVWQRIIFIGSFAWLLFLLKNQ